MTAFIAIAFPVWVTIVASRRLFKGAPLDADDFRRAFLLATLAGIVFPLSAFLLTKAKV